MGIGLSVGDVRMEGSDVHGAAVIEAVGLRDAAGSGRILCSASIVGLAALRVGSTYTPVGKLTLRDVPEPVAAVEVSWSSMVTPAPLPAALAGGDRFPFVGRSGERARLMTAWDEVREGALRVCLVAGEPGVGKTRLVADTAVDLHTRGALVLFGRCDEGVGSPYQPFAEALRFYVENVETLTLGRLGRELRRLVPDLELDDPEGDDAPASAHEPAGDVLHEAVALWLAETSSVDPVVLVLDDLHWATKPTFDMLRHVLAGTLAERLLVVATYRDGDVDRSRSLTEVLGHLTADGSSVISLDGLTLADVTDLMAAVAGFAPDDRGVELAGALHAATGGNAFFISETLRNLLETGDISYGGGAWLADPRDQLPLPRSVREVVRRRIARLGPVAKSALEVAATIGAQFEVHLLVNAVDVDLVALEPALQAAARAGLIEEVPGHDISYRFEHELVRTTLYEDLPTMKRAELHRRVAETMERVIPGHALRPGVLALHYGAAAVDSEVGTEVEWSTERGPDER
jgi:predicted ATPase